MRELQRGAGSSMTALTFNPCTLNEMSVMNFEKGWEIILKTHTFCLALIESYKIVVWFCGNIRGRSLTL